MKKQKKRPHKRKQPRKPNPKPNSPSTSATRPEEMNKMMGDFMKDMAKSDPKSTAETLNKMFKDTGHDVEITPEEVQLADFQFDGKNLMVGRPVVPTMTHKEFGASMQQLTTQFADSKLPPVTPKQLQEQMEDFAKTGAQFMAEDQGHGTMLFPYFKGAPIAIMALVGADFNDLQEGLYHAARIRVESLPGALEGFIIIAQAWVVVATPEERLGGRVSQHPKREQALVVAGAHADGWRHTICTIFDENWEVIGRMTNETPGMVLITDNMVKLLSDACFDSDAEKWRRVIRAHDAQAGSKRGQ